MFLWLDSEGFRLDLRFQFELATQREGEREKEIEQVFSSTHMKEKSNLIIIILEIEIDQSGRNWSLRKIESMMMMM